MHLSQQPKLRIGIVQSSSIKFELNGSFLCEQTVLKTGTYTAQLTSQGIRLNSIQFNSQVVKLIPQKNNCTFTLYKVKIGIGFHWEKNEEQTFNGCLQFLVDETSLWAVNEVLVEDYIHSVVSSEMNANAPFEFIKAHAIISRSWALAQIPQFNKPINVVPEQNTEAKKIVWYDKENHTLFDLCSDDHCQRYQGITRISNNNATRAVAETFGEVLTYEDQLCDARFSKCCGGISEDFENVWQPIRYNYLTAVYDAKTSNPIPSIENNETFKAWYSANPEVFCNTSNAEILSTVLNDYDQTTQDFFRWKVSYTSVQLGELIYKKCGINFGHILELTPIKRGISGRIGQIPGCPAFTRAGSLRRTGCLAGVG